MANHTKKASNDDPRLALQIMREENNVKAAAHGAFFSLLLAFNRLMDRVSRPKLGSHESAEEPPSHTRRWRQQAMLALGTAGTSWMLLSPQSHVYLSSVALVAIHLCQHVIGH